MSRSIHISTILSWIFLSCFMVACGNGGGASSTPALVLSSVGVKALVFRWAEISGATHYKLFKDPDGVSGFTQVGADIPAATTTYTDDIAVHLTDWVNARYQLEACDAVDCTGSNVVFISDAMLQAIGYIKASNTGASDSFGASVALSADGNTLAVGAYNEDSSATGIDGNETNNAGPDSGAIYVYSLSGDGWAQQAYIKSSNSEAGDEFGWSVALSTDGNTMIVGAISEDSVATGIDGNETDNSASNAGAAYVFTRTGSTWTQQAYLKGSNTEAGDNFGYAVALSTTGDMVAIAAPREGSVATGIDGNEADDSAPDAGAVYVFTRSGATWTQQAYLKASNTEAGDRFGDSLALSSDGSTLAVGAEMEDSTATGINGSQADNSGSEVGAVYVFTQSGGTWSQQAYIKASNAGTGDHFGIDTALSDDGNTLAVGAYDEDSVATGIDGNQADNSGVNSGAVYVFARAAAVWTQQAYLKASNTDAGDNFGVAVSLNDDGNTLAVGAGREDSAATGIDGDQSSDVLVDPGAVYIFQRSVGTWSQQSYVKAPNTGTGDQFGQSLALSADGDTLAVGALNEDSVADGIGGDQTDNAAPNSGAAYLY